METNLLMSRPPVSGIPSRRQTAPRDGPVAPGDLEIEAARIGVDVQKLARKIQSLHQLRFHRLRVDLGDLHAAGGHNGVLDGRFAGNGHGKAFDRLKQCSSLLLRDGVDLLHGINAAAGNDDRDHGSRQKRRKAVFKIAVLRGGKIAQNARVQRFFVQCGLEVDPDRIAWPPRAPYARWQRGSQDQRGRNG